MKNIPSPIQHRTIKTGLGLLHVDIQEIPGTEPIIFLHGLFLNKDMWKKYDSSLTGHTHIYIDLPAHGENDDVGRNWSQDECVEAIFEIANVASSLSVFCVRNSVKSSSLGNLKRIASGKSSPVLSLIFVNNVTANKE